MSETSKSTSTPKPSSSPATSESAKPASKSDTAKATDGTSSATGNGESGKSSRDSIGGAGAVHYGYFSNVKTPQYRSGWDQIWSKGTKAKKKKPARSREPVLVSMRLDELPEDLRAGLANVARARLKKSRINYDDRDRAGAVTWRIECEVKR